MIRSEAEYREARKRLVEDRLFIQAQREALEAEGFNSEEVVRGMEPTLAFHEQLSEEVAFYERIRRLDFGAIVGLEEIGRMLIAFRVGLDVPQKELARRLGVSEAVISRDERNEYHGIGIERAQRILDALGVRIVSQVELPPESPSVSEESRELMLA
jgi:DNA-directed RNA polymerase specialized sigma subunit